MIVVDGVRAGSPLLNRYRGSHSSRSFGHGGDRRPLGRYPRLAQGIVSKIFFLSGSKTKLLQENWPFPDAFHNTASKNETWIMSKNRLFRL